MLANEFEHIFSSLFLHNSEFYRRLLQALVNESATRDELIKVLGVKHGGKISGIIGLQFANLVLSNRKIIHDYLGLTVDERKCANPYFQNTTTRTKGCQIDYMIQTKFSNLYMCEIKFSSNPICIGIIKEIQDKIDKLHTPKGYSYRAVLIHAKCNRIIKIQRHKIYTPLSRSKNQYFTLWTNLKNFISRK